MARKLRPPKITIPQLRTWGACYKPDRLAAVFGRRKQLSALEICELDIPAKDRLWVLLRAEIIPAPELRKLAFAFATPVLAEGSEVVQDIAAPLWNVTRRFMRGEVTLDVLCEARSVHYHAAMTKVAPLVRNAQTARRCVAAVAAFSPRTAAYDTARHARVYWQVQYGVVAADNLAKRQLRLVRTVLKRLYIEPKVKQA
jgi:hypothetical protein